MPKRLGYARVSTLGQTLNIQVETLKGSACENIYCEKASGANLDRPKLHLLLRRISKGDTVVVTRIDRLARSAFDLFAIVKKITDSDAQFHSIAEPWADTSTSTGRLMLAVLGGLADVERDLIRIRTAEGRAQALSRGVKMGRPSLTTKEQRDEIIERRQRGENLVSIANTYGISMTTAYRITAMKGFSEPV